VWFAINLKHSQLECEYTVACNDKFQDYSDTELEDAHVGGKCRSPFQDMYLNTYGGDEENHDC